jgi:hypothetical protein
VAGVLPTTSPPCVAIAKNPRRSPSGSAAAVPPVLNPIARGHDLETVYVPVMGRYVGLPCIDEIGERMRVELRVLRVRMQVGLDDQDHAKRMCEEPTFVPDICVLGVRMLNRHRQTPSW